MSLGITELELTDASTISIPTDAILILFLLVVFAVLGYFFHNILDNQINQFVKKVDDNSNLELVQEELEDQFILKSATIDHEKSEKSIIKKLHCLLPSKSWGIGGLAFVAIGGSSLLRIQSIQNLYQGVNNSQINIKTENQSEKPLLSMAKIKASNQSQSKIKKINYVDPLLSTNKGSKNNSFLQIDAREENDFFSF